MQSVTGFLSILMDNYKVRIGKGEVEGGGWRVEGGGWRVCEEGGGCVRRVEGGGWRVEGV